MKIVKLVATTLAAVVLVLAASVAAPLAGGAAIGVVRQDHAGPP